MTERPDLRDLVGDETPAEELARLERVHNLLTSVGPPPELSPLLAEAPSLRRSEQLAEDNLTWLPRRRMGAVIGLAATIALALFGLGYLVGKRGTEFEIARTLRMHGTAAAQRASATIQVGTPDSAGNTRLRVRLNGLPEAPDRTYYELYLTDKGKISRSCGTVAVHGGTTTVTLSIAYALERYTGWVLTRERFDAPPGSHTVMLRTRQI
ncbi:MAG: anti-sigma factor [Gaiellaceae bacterium]